MYIAKDRGHPAFKPSMKTAIVTLDGKQVLDWFIANSELGYVVTNNPLPHTQHRGVVTITQPEGLERIYVNH